MTTLQEQEIQTRGRAEFDLRGETMDMDQDDMDSDSDDTDADDTDSSDADTDAEDPS